MPFFLTNRVDPIPLCPRCYPWPQTWQQCWKARMFHEKGWDFPQVCPSYGGDMKYYNWNVKHVSEKDFDKYRNEGFHEAERLSILIRDGEDSNAIKEWLRGKENDGN